MFELIKLEWKKNRIAKYIRNAAIMTTILLVFIVAMAGELAADTSMEAQGRSVVNASVDMFVNMCYIIFTGVMLASFVVGAYEKKTINLMFSYPISRKKILLSKVFAVWIFNFIGMVASKVIAYVILLMMKVPSSTIQFTSLSFCLDIMIGSAAMVSITYIALLIGLKMKSTKATIITSVILVCLTQGNIGAYTLKDNFGFYIVLLALAVVSVFLTIYNAETKDVM
jgi:ABC-type transport system involved in multi-copper enzyme maturation permease subunit